MPLAEQWMSRARTPGLFLSLYFRLEYKGLQITKMQSLHLLMYAVIIIVSFKILGLCPIALFQQL